MNITTYQAEFIIELLYQAGWIDDPDELIGDYQKQEGTPAAIEKANMIDDLISKLNDTVPYGAQVPVHKKIIEYVK